MRIRDVAPKFVLSLVLATALCMPAGMAFAEGFQTSEDVSEETHQPAVISDEEVAEVLSGLSEESLQSPSERMELSAADDAVIELAGDTQYDTAAAEALHVFSSSEYAIVASGVNAVDAFPLQDSRVCLNARFSYALKTTCCWLRRTPSPLSA